MKKLLTALILSAAFLPALTANAALSAAKPASQPMTELRLTDTDYLYDPLPAAPDKALGLYSADGSTSYVDILSENERKVYQTIKKNLDPSKIEKDSDGLYRIYIECPVGRYFDLSDTAAFQDSAQKIFRCIQLNDPELHWISVEYMIFGSNGLFLYTMFTDTEMQKNLSPEEVRQNISAVDTWKNNIISTAAALKDRYSKIKYIDTAIRDMTEYGYSDTEPKAYSHNVAGIALNGKAVCEGYAKAVKLLANGLDIPCVMMTGTGTNSSGTEPHGWNAVLMEDGKWYMLDTTWNDTARTNKYFLAGEDVFGINHDYQNPLGLDLAKDNYVYGTGQETTTAPVTEAKTETTTQTAAAETTTYSYNGFFYGISDGKAAILGYDGRLSSDGDVIIPSKINGIDVIAVADNAFKSNISAKGNIIIEDGIKKLGSKAFWSCTAQKFIIPASVTEFEYNEWGYVFSYSSAAGFEVDENNPSFCSDDGVLYSKDKKILYCYPALREGETYTVGEETKALACTSFGHARRLKKLYITGTDTDFSTYTFCGCQLEIYGKEENTRLKEHIERLMRSAAENNDYNSYGNLTYAVIGSGDTPQPDKKTYTPGDVDMDGAITAADSAMLLQKTLNEAYTLPIEKYIAEGKIKIIIEDI